MALLTRENIQTLIEEQSTPQISIYIPTHRAGAEIQQDAIRLKNALAQAEEKLVERGMRRVEAQELLEPASTLVDDHNFWKHQSDGLALFLSPERWAHFRLPLDFEEQVVVTELFHLTPLLPMLNQEGRFFILTLSQGNVRLLQGTPYSVGEVDTENMPQSLAEALRWDDPERRVQWHSQTGTPVESGRPRSTGGPGGPQVVAGDRGAMFHGQGSDEDDVKEEIRRYFQKIDHGLVDLLDKEDWPVVLSGVDYLLPMYREVSHYPHLMEQGIEGNPEEMGKKELHAEAWSIVAPHFQQAQQEATELYKRSAHTERATNDIEEIVSAAYFERVSTLFVDRDAHQWGTFDPESNQVVCHPQKEPGDVDLLDLAAIHTYRNSGTVYAVTAEELPDQGPVAALFRY
jgi:hypothetical protein